MTTRSWSLRLKAEDLRLTLEQLRCWDGSEELTFLLDSYQVPSACAPSLLAARRAFEAAERHLKAAAVIADDLAGGSDD